MDQRARKSTGKAGSNKPATSRRAVRDPAATRARVLAAAKVEFARLGLEGARVDAIAARAKANKRMIYHYFGGKQDLFLAVLEDAYADIRGAERRLALEHLDPLEAIRTLVTFTWNYYLKHPEFLSLVSNENLHKARHLKSSQAVVALHGPFLEMIGGILARGEASGVFRPGIDTAELSLTIAAINYYYLTNRFTNSFLYGRDLGAPEELEKRLAFNIDTIGRLLKA